jgi:hypothetical protein
MTINPTDFSLTFQTMLPVPATRPKNKAKVPLDFVPGRYAILCGRGKVCSASPGNKHLKSLIIAYLTPYSRAKNKIEKSTIVSAIVNAVRKETPVGAFVKQDKNREWWEVEDSFAREKIGCIFRDILHTQYRSSTKAKFARKKALENTGGAHKSWKKKNLLNTSNHSQSSYDTCGSSESRFASTNRAHTVPSSMLVREDKDPSLVGEQCISAGRIRFPTDHLGGQSECAESDQRHASSQPLGMPATFSCKNEFTQYRPQPRFDILRDFTAAGLSYDNRKSTASLMNDAFEIIGVAELDDDDFPDDLSAIFDDDDM